MTDGQSVSHAVRPDVPVLVGLCVLNTMSVSLGAQCLTRIRVCPLS
jgi:hypothetical protein